MIARIMQATGALALGILGCSVVVEPARACGISDATQRAAAGWAFQPSWQAGAAGLRAQTGDVDASVLSTQAEQPAHGGGSIVGLWKFTFLSLGNPGIPDGAVIDAGFQLWHSDGTEMTNSSRPPPSSNFCMGAWQQHRNATVDLNHWALSWDDTGTTFVGPANIREQVRVDRHGDTFSGSFTIDQYAADGVTVLAHVGGTTTAVRIEADD